MILFRFTPIGYVLFGIWEYVDTEIRFPEMILYLLHICVLNEYRGCKVGEKLINQVKHFSQEQNIHRIELDYWIRNIIDGKFFLYED